MVQRLIVLNTSHIDSSSAMRRHRRCTGVVLFLSFFLRVDRDLSATGGDEVVVAWFRVVTNVPEPCLIWFGDRASVAGVGLAMGRGVRGND